MAKNRRQVALVAFLAMNGDDMNKRNDFFTECGMAALMLALLVPLSVSASLDDKVLTFSTPGTDHYADGTPVADGECYALVWSPAGTVFSGFNADGTAASPQDRVVLAAPVARNGRCPESIFQIPAGEYAELEGGEWTVCLVDTRRADGVPAGAENGVPKRVNRWVAIEGGVAVTSASSLTAVLRRSALQPRAIGATGTGVLATTRSSVPENAPQPTITAMEVGDGVAAFAVADTVPYLTYTVESSESLDGFHTDKYADKVDGDTDAEIVLATDAPGDCRFFRITRAE